MNLPSCVKEWHIPLKCAFPVPVGVFFLVDPEEEQETSYFALSVKILSRSISNITKPEQMFVFYYIITHTLLFVKCFE